MVGMYDLIIVGAGPAGITAAVYAARKRMKTLVLTKDIGGQAAISGDIQNWPGEKSIMGPNLAKKFEEHMKSYGIEVKEKEEVAGIEKSGENFKVKTGTGEYWSISVVIATGRKPRLLNIPGEKEFKNKGVSYCATCDAPLFGGKTVAVIGGGNSALDAVMQFIAIAEKTYLVNVNPDMRGDKYMIEKAKKAGNVEVLYNTKTEKITGEVFVKSIEVRTGDGKARTLDVQGVFVEIGSVPVLVPVKPEVKLDKRNEIIVNERCETGIDGLFAAGDVTNVPEKQVVVAAGQGCIASISAFNYVSKKTP